MIKKGYAVSLTQESVGGHLRDNDISLLGMRQDDDWVLYAAYNDQEKIRNVFSCNLWKDFCSTDNERGIDTGVEYRYLELFMNGDTGDSMLWDIRLTGSRCRSEMILPKRLCIRS